MGCACAKAKASANHEQLPHLLVKERSASPKSNGAVGAVVASSSFIASGSHEDIVSEIAAEVVAGTILSITPRHFRYHYEQHLQERREVVTIARAVKARMSESRSASSWPWTCCGYPSSTDEAVEPLLQPLKVAAHYGFPEGTGKGQKVAIIGLDGSLNMDELQSDFKALNVKPPVNLKKVDVGTIPKGGNGQNTLETHLDVETIGSICPDASITIYRASNVGLQPFADAVEKAVEDGNSVISISWGLPEYHDLADSPLADAMEKAAKAGVTVCVAAGDGGSGDARNGKGAAVPASDKAAHVDWPAASPFVLACGGTQLMSSGEEHVWNKSAQGGGASGGGVSVIVPAPTWQAGLLIDGARADGRIVPDVAGLASGSDWSIAEKGRLESVGGTSAVAPLWAALVVLANEERAKVGKKTVGFFNEELYNLAKVKQDDLFVGIVKGDNRPTPSYPGYDATIGFDACTGWGVPKGAAIFKFLVDLA